MLEVVLLREFQNEGWRHSSSQTRGQDVPSVSVRVAGKGIQTSHTHSNVSHEDARGGSHEHYSYLVSDLQNLYSKNNTENVFLNSARG